MNKITKRIIGITAAVVMLLGVLTIGVAAVGAAEAETTAAAQTTIANTDATSASMPVSTGDSASKDSATPDIPNTGNGSIPTGDSNAAVWAVAAISFIVAATGVAFFAHRRKESE